MIILTFTGLYFQKEQKDLVDIFFESGYEAGPYGNPSMYYGVLSVLCCGFSVFVALKTMQRLRNMGLFFLLLNIGFGLFAIATISSPRGISLKESLWAWWIYSILALVWALVAHQRIDHAPLPKPLYDDDILDD